MLVLAYYKTGADTGSLAGGGDFLERYIQGRGGGITSKGGLFIFVTPLSISCPPFRFNILNHLFVYFIPFLSNIYVIYLQV